LIERRGEAIERVPGPSFEGDEVLRGRRSLSLNMIRELHDKFGIPANVLIQPGRNREKSAQRHTSRRLRGAAKRQPRTLWETNSQRDAAPENFSWP